MDIDTFFFAYLIELKFSTYRLELWEIDFLYREKKNEEDEVHVLRMLWKTSRS